MNNPTTSSSSSFTNGWTWTYDVFISFRGVDTRSGFAGNLYQALRAKEVKTFKDDEDLEAGEEIGPALDKAIQESRIALVIFSKNYASSRFCLEELAKIIECSKDNGMLVWPIFYQVEPFVVRHQKGSYAEALANHVDRFEKEKIAMWRAALIKAADVSGFSSDGYKYEYQFIDKIVQDVSKKITILLDCDKNQILGNVDDEYIVQQDRYDYFGAVRNARGKKKELPPQDAALLIQISFRAYLIRRSKALRALRDLAVAKSKLREIRAQFNNFSYRRRVAHDAEERQRFSEKVLVLLLTVDAIEGADLMVRSVQRSMVDELGPMLDVIDPKPAGTGN